jgi:hypothetical protein
VRRARTHSPDSRGIHRNPTHSLGNCERVRACINALIPITIIAGHQRLTRAQSTLWIAERTATLIARARRTVLDVDRIAVIPILTAFTIFAGRVLGAIVAATGRL